MKKVLSVLLAAAMVMGMSVSSFALTISTDDKNTANDSKEYVSFGKNYGTFCDHENPDGTTKAPIVDVENITFAPYIYIGGEAYHDEDLKNATLNPGDVLYFVPLVQGDEINYSKKVVDEHWSINVKGSEYVKSVGWAWDSSYNLLVKVVLADNLDELEEQEIRLSMYIADNYDSDTKEQSQGVTLVMPFDNVIEKYVHFDRTNDVDYMAKWVVKKGESGKAVFDFEDAAYFTSGKMISEEAVIFNFSQAYDKDFDRAYNDNDGDLSFYNFKGTKDEFMRKGELFIPAEEGTYIYEIVDGEPVEIDAEFEESYKVDGFKAKSGWVIETKELGYYVVSTEELVVEEAEDNTNSSTSTDKTNPETGANDFVGAAVALAVVSVAAAGALAFKK